MVETGRREGLKPFTSLKIKEARKRVGFVCSAEMSEDASDWGWSHIAPVLLFLPSFWLLQCVWPSSVPLTWRTCHITPCQVCVTGAGRGWKHNLPFLAVAGFWTAWDSPVCWEQQLAEDLILLWNTPLLSRDNPLGRRLQMHVKRDEFPLQSSEHTLGPRHPPVLFSSVLILRKKTQNQHPSHPLFMQAYKYHKVNGSPEKWHTKLSPDAARL